MNMQLVLVVGACILCMVCGQYVIERKILASDSSGGALFGRSVSISGDYAIVGANFDNDNGSTSGSAYVYSRNQGGVDNWDEVKKLFASDADAGDQYGISVSISGEYAIVGAFLNGLNGTSSGSAYIYYRNQGGLDNWGEVKHLHASDAFADDQFGFSVSISGDYAIIGANQNDDNGSSSGSAYVYYRNQGGSDNWGEVKKLVASDAFGSDFFGYSVSISGDYAIVGAHRNSDNGSDSGSAYIYYLNQDGLDNWGEIKKLLASDAFDSDEFGSSVSISGDYVIVGAYGNDDNGSESGSAYLFNRNQGGTDKWGEVRHLRPNDANDTDRFGFSVSISGDYAIVGAHQNDYNGSNSGSAYIYYRNQGGSDNWAEVKKLLASDAFADDYFGLSVSISGNYAIVGAFADDDNGSSSGSAYIFGPSLPESTLTTAGSATSGEIETDSGEGLGTSLIAVLSAIGGVVALMLLIAACACAGLVCAVFVCCVVLCVAALVCTVAFVVVVAVGGAGVVGAGGLGGGLGLSRVGQGSHRQSDFILDSPQAACIDAEELSRRMRETTDFRRIPFVDITLGQQIGAGAYGAVYIGKWSGARVAVKILATDLSAEAQEEFEHEALMMAKVSHHPNIVQFIGVSIERERLGIVLQMCTGGSLLESLRKKRLDTLSKRRVLGEVGSAIAFLHMNGVVHRDIAARNVLLDSTDTAMLSDLGLARIMEEGMSEQSTKSNVGPVRWMAPEALTEHKYSTASDMWSFGVLVWEVWSDGAMPYSQYTALTDVMMAVVHKGYRLEKPAECPADQQQMMDALFAIQPTSRPGMASVISQYFANESIIGQATDSYARDDASSGYISPSELTDVM